MFYPKSDLERIKQAVDGRALLDHLGLMDGAREFGGEVRRCCPIHNGDNRSAWAYDLANNRWYCHTRCNKGGDLFTLVQKVKNFSFKQAVEYIAAFAGVTLSTAHLAGDELVEMMNRQRREAKRRKCEELLASLQTVRLPALTPLPEVTLSGRLQTEVPEQLGIRAETWLEFGAVICHEDDYKGEFRDGRWEYPRGFMSNRLALPIRDPEGRTVGYTGRKLREHQQPKWLNSKNLEKASVLFGIDKAKRGIAETATVVLVEGPKDVLGLWQNGVRNAVAVLGCEVHAVQASLLYWCYAREFWLAFDGDKAGEGATAKMAERLRRYGFLHVFGIPIPNGKDPDELTLSEWNDCVARRYRL